MKINLKPLLVYVSIIILSLLVSWPFFNKLVNKQIQMMHMNPDLSEITLTNLSMINPLILSLIALLIGHFLHEKTELKSIIYEKGNFKDTILVSVISGVLVGLCLGMGNLVFNSGAEDMIVEKASFINLLGGISHGGIIEELITRFGLMTFITFMLVKIFKRKTTFIYIISIILSAVIFSLGHLPSALVGIDEHYFIIIVKVITLNTFAGTVYGFLYYKYYLESAMLAHVFTHMTMQTLYLFSFK